MQPFREFLGYWNELGLAISGLMTIGYFGARGLLGRLPALLAIGIIIAAIALAWILSQPLQQSSEDDFYPENSTNKGFERFMLYFGLFIWGSVVFVYFGSCL